MHRSCPLLALLLVSTTASASASGGWSLPSLSSFMSSSTKALDDALHQPPDQVLSKVENSIDSVTAWTKTHHHAIQTAAGATLIFCSKRLTYTLLFVESFKAVGWPIVLQGAKELRSSYAQARAAFRAELPTLMKSRELLPKLLEQKRDAEELLAKAATFAKAVEEDAKEADRRFRKAAKAIEKALPSRRELDRVAMAATKGLPSRREVESALKTAKRAQARVERQLKAAETSTTMTTREARALVRSLTQEKREAEAALAAATATYDRFESAVRAAVDQARRALPNRRELQAAEDAAMWAKKTADSKLKEGLRLQREALVQFEAAMATADDALKVSNSVEAVADALDADKVKKIGTGVAAGFTSCVASATSPLAGSALVGVDVGSLISAKALPVARGAKKLAVARFGSRVPASVIRQTNATRLSSWAEGGVRTASVAAGVWVAHRTRQLALLCTGALLGAKMVVAAAERPVERLLSKTDVDEKIAEGAAQLVGQLDRLDGVEDGAIGAVKLPKATAKATAELALAGLGVALQLGLLGGGIGALPGIGLLRAPLAPIFAFESYLKASAAATAAKAAAIKAL